MKNDIDIKKELVNIDFEYSGCIDYEAESIQSPDHDTICANDYCRCSTMNMYINSINNDEISKYICDKFDIKDNIIKNRVLNICRKLTIDDFECHVCGGYYGEETDGITLENYNIISELELAIDIKKSREKKLQLIKLSEKENEKIKKILISEYGYLLDKLKNSNFSEIEISTSDVIFPSKIQSDNVGKKYLYSYKKHKICGIVRQKGDKYLVIDGYHRITANLKNEKIKVILSY